MLKFNLSLFTYITSYWVLTWKYTYSGKIFSYVLGDIMQLTIFLHLMYPMYSTRWRISKCFSHLYSSTSVQLWLWPMRTHPQIHTHMIANNLLPWQCTFKHYYIHLLISTLFSMLLNWRDHIRNQQPGDPFLCSMYALYINSQLHINTPQERHLSGSSISVG